MANKIKEVAERIEIKKAKLTQIWCSLYLLQKGDSIVSYVYF